MSKLTDEQKIKLILSITSDYFEFGTNEKNKGAYLEGIIESIDQIAGFQEDENA